MYDYVTGDLLKFDYGAEENLRRYNSTKPPQYDLGQVKVPSYMFWSGNDLYVNKAVYTVLQSS